MSILDTYLISQAFARDPALLSPSSSSASALLLRLAGASPPSRRPFRPTPATGRVSKRKPRVSKRLPTTYIVADPANFREMVQHVTGVREAPVEPVVQPEEKPVETAENSCLLPTLDTSALLLDRAREVDSGSIEPDRLDFDPFFPTLESWGVV